MDQPSHPEATVSVEPTVGGAAVEESEPDPPHESPADEAHGVAAEQAIRLAKLEALRAGGADPYPYRFDRSAHVGGGADRARRAAAGGRDGRAGRRWPVGSCSSAAKGS